MSDYTNLYIKHRREKSVTRTRDPHDEWDRGNTSSTHYVDGISIKSDGYCSNISIIGEVNPGDTVWLVWAVYSTGDSFGHDDGECIEFVTVTRYETTARKIAQTLSKIPNDVDSNYTVPIFLDNGEVMKYTVPWLGYFDRLDYIEVQNFTVTSANQNRYLPKPR